MALESTVAPGPGPGPRPSSRRSSAYRLFPPVDAEPPPSPTIPQNANFLKPTESSRNRSTSLNNNSAKTHSSSTTDLSQGPSWNSDEWIDFPELRPTRTLPDSSNPSLFNSQTRHRENAAKRSPNHDDRRYSKYLPGSFSEICRLYAPEQQQNEPLPAPSKPTAIPIASIPERSSSKRMSHYRVATFNEQRSGHSAPTPKTSFVRSPQHSRSSSGSDASLASAPIPHDRVRSSKLSQASTIADDDTASALADSAVGILHAHSQSDTCQQATVQLSQSKFLLPRSNTNKPLPPVNVHQVGEKTFLPRPDSTAMPSNASNVNCSFGLLLPGAEDDLPPTPPPKDECRSQGDPHEHFSHDLFVSPRLPASLNGQMMEAAADVGSLATVPEPKSKYSELFDQSSLDGRLPPSTRPSRSSSKASLARAEPAEPKSSKCIASPGYCTLQGREKYTLGPAAKIDGPRSSHSSNGSFAYSDRSPSSTPELSTFTRVTTPALLSRQTSNSSPFIDPTLIIQDLAEQSEALNVKYATLKADRLKLSNKIIDTLKQPSNVWDMSKLLDEQLSLAAISSSMDICFAKLRSVECRREDAIAALMAQSSHKPRKTHTNKPSLGPTTPGSFKSLRSPPFSISTPNFHAGGRAPRLHKYQYSNDDLDRENATHLRVQGSSSSRDLKYCATFDNQSVNGSSSDLMEALDSVDLSEYMDSDYDMEPYGGCDPIKESPHELSTKKLGNYHVSKTSPEHSHVMSRPAYDQGSIKAPSVSRSRGFKASKLLKLFSSGNNTQNAKFQDSHAKETSQSHQQRFDLDAMSASIYDDHTLPSHDAVSSSLTPIFHPQVGSPVHHDLSSPSTTPATPPEPSRAPPVPPTYLQSPVPAALMPGFRDTSESLVTVSTVSSQAEEQSACKSFMSSASLISSRSGASDNVSCDENTMTPRPNGTNRSSICSLGASQRLQVFLGYDDEKFQNF